MNGQVVSIDINADAGESFGPWLKGSDEQLFPLVSSVNLACGLHAGDPLTMKTSVGLAKGLGVHIGAHPGFPDLVGFGRRELEMTPDELYSYVLYQVGALSAFLQAAQLPLSHVKAHGALYLKMVKDELTATTVAHAVSEVAPGVPIVVLGGPGGMAMQQAAEAHGLRAVTEAFPDRGYFSSGHLVPRNRPDAIVRDPMVAAERAVQIATTGTVDAVDGGVAQVQADTLCIHGDNKEADEIARAVRTSLASAGIEVRPF